MAERSRGSAGGTASGPNIQTTRGVLFTGDNHIHEVRQYNISPGYHYTVNAEFWKEGREAGASLTSYVRQGATAVECRRDRDEAE